MMAALKHLVELSEDEEIRLLTEERERQWMIQADNEDHAWKQGEKEGRKEGRKEMALSLLDSGLDTDFITKHTRLTPEEIEALKKER